MKLSGLHNFEAIKHFYKKKYFYRYIFTIKNMIQLENTLFISYPVRYMDV